MGFYCKLMYFINKSIVESLIVERLSNVESNFLLKIIVYLFLSVLFFIYLFVDYCSFLIKRIKIKRRFRKFAKCKIR